MKLLNVSITCMKTIYVPPWISVTLSEFDFLLTFSLTWNTPRISQFSVFISCEQLPECCCLVNSPAHVVNGFSGHLWLSYITAEERHFSFSNPSFTANSLFIIWTPLSNFFFHFQLIVYTYFPIYGLSRRHELGYISFISCLFRHIWIFYFDFINLEHFHYVPFPRSLLLVAKSDFLNSSFKCPPKLRSVPLAPSAICNISENNLIFNTEHK